MDFTAFQNEIFIGSLYAVSILVFLYWWCRSIGTKHTEKVVEPRDGDDTARDEILEPKHKVFLNHSGAQKHFVEQFCVELERRDRYPFLDKGQYSLPIGRNFPKLIFKAIEHFEVGVVILSEKLFTQSNV